MNDTAAGLTKQSKFRGEVLNKIYRVWLFRKLLPVLAAEILVLSAALYFLGRSIFIQRVIENGLNVLFLDPSRIFPFLVGAFSGATLTTKIFGAAVLVFLALVIRHLTQGFLRLILVRQNYFSRIQK